MAEKQAKNGLMRKTSLKRSRSLVQAKNLSDSDDSRSCSEDNNAFFFGFGLLKSAYFFLVFLIGAARWNSKRRTWLWNSRGDRIARCKQSGCHHFIGWRHILLTFISGEGVTCLQFFKCRKLAFVFHKNVMPLNELIGYIELTYSNKIWPEHPSGIKEQKCVRD